MPLPGGAGGARQLSGITWADGTRYYAVSDKVPSLFVLTIGLDPQQGTVQQASVERGAPVAGSTDLEGIAYDAADAAVLVSDEQGPAIREYRIADGTLLRTVAMPAVCSHIRHNLSFESLSFEPGSGALWTANEETLTCDGPASSATAGSVVRLQRFDRAFQPNGEWAYITDALFGDMLLHARDKESSGVSDLAALPDGRLLVLERAYGVGGLRIRIYEADLTHATDISALPSLAQAATYKPAHKTLLWQRIFPDINYEGLALGPTLADGGRSLILISDDGHQLRQALYALIVRPRAG